MVEEYMSNTKGQTKSCQTSSSHIGTLESENQKTSRHALAIFRKQEQLKEIKSTDKAAKQDKTKTKLKLDTL